MATSSPSLTRPINTTRSCLQFFLLLSQVLFVSESEAQSFRQQYEQRIDAAEQAEESKLRKFIEPFVDASVCFTVNSNSYSGGTNPIVCKKNDGTFFVAYGGVPKGNYWNGYYSGSIYGQNGYYFTQMQKSGREDVAARLTLIDANTIRIQYGSSACSYSPVLECQLSDKECYSREGPAGRLSIISKEGIIDRYR